MDQYAPEWLRRVQDLVSQRLTEAISVADMAKAAGQSERHFARTFKAATGYTPHRYLNVIRIERAKSLLKQRVDEPLLRIAQDCGFFDEAHFIRVFRKHTGLTPGEFRTK